MFLCYTLHMESKSKPRKKRSDRMHILYTLINAATGEFYVGLTAGNSRRALDVRFRKHVQRALAENKAWTLCEDIRAWGREAYIVEVLEMVRGKEQAHYRERELISELSPSLNSV